jgi:hypothetical protein
MYSNSELVGVGIVIKVTTGWLQIIPSARLWNAGEKEVLVKRIILVVRGDCCLGDGSVLSALSDHVSDVRIDDDIEKAIAYANTNHNN